MNVIQLPPCVAEIVEVCTPWCPSQVWTSSSTSGGGATSSATCSLDRCLSYLPRGSGTCGRVQIASKRGREGVLRMLWTTDLIESVDQGDHITIWCTVRIDGGVSSRVGKAGSWLGIMHIGYKVMSSRSVAVVGGGKCLWDSVCAFRQSDANLADVLESCQREMPNVKALVMVRSVDKVVPQISEVELEPRQTTTSV